jgi:hypothetical protein
MKTGASAATDEATLVFGGDTTSAYLASQTLELGPDVYWPKIAELFRGHDVAVVNLESPLISTTVAPPTKTGPVLTGSTSFASFLASSGVTAVTLANNHIMDAGAAGLESTRDALLQANVACVGAGATLAAAQEPLLIRTPAGTIGLLSVAEGEFSSATARSGGAAPLYETAIVAQLRSLSSACSLLIVVYHGGHEGYPLPSPDMVRRCRAFADAGAAAVVCHHAHVVSGCEVHGESVIAYGLGNLMFDVPTPPYPGWNVGALLSLRVRSGKVVEWRLIGTEQRANTPAVGLQSNSRGFEEELAKNSGIVSNGVDLAAEFSRFCRSEREYRLAALLGLNRVERRLVRWGVHPWWRIRRSAYLSILGTIQCESNREAAVEILRQELGLSAGNDLRGECR